MTFRINTNNTPKLSHYDAKPSSVGINPLFFIPIIGQILFLIQFIGKALSENKSMKNRTVTPDLVNTASARKVTAAAKKQGVRKERTRKGTSNPAASSSAKKVEQAEKKQVLAPKAAPSSVTSSTETAQHLTSRKRSPGPEEVYAASRALYTEMEKQKTEMEKQKTEMEKQKKAAQEESEGLIIPIIGMAGDIRNSRNHTKQDEKILKILMNKQADFEQKYGLTDLIGPLTRLYNVINSTPRE